MSDETEKYRKEIAEIDRQIFGFVKSRLIKAKKIGEAKKQRDLPVTNLKVELEVVERSLKLAKEIGLNEVFAKKLVSMLISEAIKVQGAISENRAAFLYDIFEKAMELKARGEKVIRLEVGEPNISSPIELKDALKNSLYQSRFIGYSSSKGLLELRKALAEDLNQKYSADINEEQILITPGGKFAIFSAILSMVSLGDHVIIPEPTWPAYSNCVYLANGRVDTIHSRFENSWDIDIREVEEIFVVKPKLFILCSPNNPTGKIFSEKFLSQVTQLAEKKGTYLLVDEVYSSYSSVPPKSILEITDSHFIYINSFSKSHGMTGWRIGYAVSDIKTITMMRNILQVSVTCVPEFIQRAALEALKMKQDIFNSFAKNMSKRIDVACKELDKLPFKYFRPDGGMYIFPKGSVKNFNSYDFAYQLLENEKVVVCPGEAFGNYPEHLRISLGTSMEDIKNGIKKMGKVIGICGKG